MSSRSLKINLSGIAFRGALKDRGYDQSFNTRYVIVTHIVEEIRKAIHSREKLAILDLGGYNGAARELLNDNVTILDVFEDDKLEDYIKVDSVNIPKPDNSFDIVISTDVIEHINRDDRAKFINEAVRVAKYGVVILAPFDHGDGEVTREELYADSMYQGETGDGYIWLKEHREYGLPKRSWIEKFLKNKGVSYARASHTSLRLWGDLIVNGFFFADNIYQVDKKSGNLLRKMNNIYFDEVAAVDFPENGYRTIYVISEYFSDISIKTPEYNRRVIDDFIAANNMRLGKAIAKMSADIFAQSVQIKNNQQIIMAQKAQLEDYARQTNSRSHKAIRVLQRVKRRITGQR